MKRMARIRTAAVMAGLAAGLLAGCSMPDSQFTDGEWVSQTATGRGSYERGDYRRAADAYARAALRAQAMDDADAVAVSAVNRAVCLLAEKKPDEALPGIMEALADPRVSPARRAELGIMASRIELALGQPEQAKQSADEVLQMKLSPPLRAQGMLVKSAAELALGEPEKASRTLSKGLSGKAWRKLPLAFQAERSVRLAELAAVNGQLLEAAEHQATAADLYRQAKRLKEMADSLVSAGRLNRESGRLDAACNQFYRAARSLWAQGLREEASAALAEGMACAEELNDEAMSRRMAGLLVTFEAGERLAE